MGIEIGLGILTSMLTPAILISACGTLILSTSSRLGRVVDRVRNLFVRFEELSQHGEVKENNSKRISIIFSQLSKLTKRSKYLQRGITSFYVSLSFFVGTSVVIGILNVIGKDFNWIPIALGIFGAVILLYGSIMLILETKLALSSVHEEMDFLLEMGQVFAPKELLEIKKKKLFS